MYEEYTARPDGRGFRAYHPNIALRSSAKYLARVRVKALFALFIEIAPSEAQNLFEVFLDPHQTFSKTESRA